MIYWMFLAASIALEVVGVLLLNHAAQTNAPSAMFIMYALVIASYFMLSKAVKRIPLGIAYALWEGAGIILITASSVVLFGEQHDRLWDIVKAELKKIMPPEGFGATEEKINGAFRSGYGTVMFFEDQSVVEGLQKQFPLYKDAFHVFSLNSAGMLQYVVWTALAEQGIGASLQHYNPVIDEAVRVAWDLPTSWKLSAQMPFGKPIADPVEKTFQAIESRVKVFK